MIVGAFLCLESSKYCSQNRFCLKDDKKKIFYSYTFFCQKYGKIGHFSGEIQNKLDFIW